MVQCGQCFEGQDRKRNAHKHRGYIQHSDDQRSGGGIVVQAVVLLDGEITLVFRTILCFLNVNQILQHCCRSVRMPVFGV